MISAWFNPTVATMNGLGMSPHRTRTDLRPVNVPTYAGLRTRTDAPPGSSWGLFGAHDQLGTLNFLAFNDLRAAASEIQAGQAFSLDLPSTAINPSLAPTRRPVEHHIFERTPFHRDEWLDHFYTQYGSQLDGLRHIGHPEHGFYNGADPRLFLPGEDLLGIHHIAALPVAGRAVLLDVDRHLRDQGRPIQQHSDFAVSARDLEETRAAQDVTVRPGDIVLIRFGWLRWYLEDASPQVRADLRTEQFHPGLEQSHDVLAWLWDHQVSLIAADNFALERWPAAPDSPFYTHAERDEGFRDPHSGIMHRAIIGLLGMPIGELWNLDALAASCAADRRWSLLLTVAPLSIVGGIGSPANAIALR
ncbi:cyclase family protein [Streptomyces griseorubiginosus]|uniref:cyclase family protein n=1 Tax=Streptomyces griseorubiginosus TaxID=67304 RepID=UPI001AD6CE4E|nr:cyclase family protein [Streptomyces griseorubiginosus]MBO4256208.1 cyclase family protein [Streptomyces griseorubiginosus]